MTDEEIVRVLAEKVMGWTYCGACRRYPGWHTGEAEPGFSDINWEFRPLTSDADACAVLDKMAETHDVNLVIRHQRPPQADAADYVGCYFGLAEAFLPMSSAGRRRAICLAALKAIGVNTK